MLGCDKKDIDVLFQEDPFSNLFDLHQIIPLLGFRQILFFSKKQNLHKKELACWYDQVVETWIEVQNGGMTVDCISG